MLHLEYSEVIVVNGKTVNLFRDHVQENKYWFLPFAPPTVARNGKDFLYTVLTDGAIVEIEDDTDDLDKVEGYLNLSTELGPTPAEQLLIEEELKRRKGLDNIILAQPNYLQGSANITLMATEKGDTENTEIKIVGSGKPAMYGSQRATFAAKLQGNPAKLLYYTLKDKSAANINVTYEFVTLAYRPAYNVKITVDFKTVDEYWDHQIDLNSKVEFGKPDKNGKRSKIAGKVDIDIFLQNLISEGAIKVEINDYRDPGATPAEQSNLEKEISDQVKLVKGLIGSMLFEVKPMPPNTKQILEKSTTVPDSGKDKDAGGDGEDPGLPKPIPTKIPTDGAHTEPGKKKKKTKTTTPKKQEPTDKIEGRTDSGAKDNAEDKVEKKKPESVKKKDLKKGEDSTEETKVAKSETNDTALPVTYDVNVGYTLKRRKITQQVKRVFEFKKAGAVRYPINPSGILQLKDTGFSPEDQVLHYNTQDGPFKEMEIAINAIFDFEAYEIEEVILHLAYGYKGNEGDKSNRLHNVSYRFTKGKTNQKIKFFVDQYGTQSYDYYIEFIHSANSIIGTHETKITSRFFREETESVISINLTEHSPLVPVDIQLGNLLFSDDGVRSVQIFIAPDKTALGRTLIYNQQQQADQKYLIHPSVFMDEAPTYYYRTEFFFKGDRLTFEHEQNKDVQIIINSPDTRILKIAPTLVNTAMIEKALLDVRYTDSEGAVKQTVLDLSPSTSTSEAFSLLVEEDDPRSWEGKGRFVLKNGQLLEGDWLPYENIEPFINLAKNGFRIISVEPILGGDTFSGSIAAIAITFYDPTNKANTTNNLLLRKNSAQGTIVLEGISDTTSSIAEVKIYRKDGTSETQEIMVPPQQSKLDLFIFNT